jgi:hypothetical protein
MSEKSLMKVNADDTSDTTSDTTSPNTQRMFTVVSFSLGCFRFVRKYLSLIHYSARGPSAPIQWAPTPASGGLPYPKLQWKFLATVFGYLHDMQLFIALVRPRMGKIFPQCPLFWRPSKLLGQPPAWSFSCLILMLPSGITYGTFSRHPLFSCRQMFQFNLISTYLTGNGTREVNYIRLPVFFFSHSLG